MGVAAILPELALHEAHATFFLIGADAVKRPDLVRAIAAAGHEIGDHSFTHVRMVGHSGSFYDREIEQTQAALLATGLKATLFRPPLRQKSSSVCPEPPERHGLKMILWDVEDPVTSDPRVFADQDGARRQARLHHPGPRHVRPNGVARVALPAILDGLAAKRLQVVTVSELIANRAP